MHEILFPDLESEIQITHKLLKAVPTDQLGFKPHPKNMSLGELAWHIATLFGWQIQVLKEDGVDLAELDNVLQGMPVSAEEIAATFDRNASAFLADLRNTMDGDLLSPYTMRFGDRVLSSQPKAAVVRQLGINHIVHHRAQLGLYLRLLDVPLPATYGVSADENPLAA